MQTRHGSGERMTEAEMLQHLADLNERLVRLQEDIRPLL